MLFAKKVAKETTLPSRMDTKIATFLLECYFLPVEMNHGYALLIGPNHPGLHNLTRHKLL